MKILLMHITTYLYHEHTRKLYRLKGIRPMYEDTLNMISNWGNVNNIIMGYLVTFTLLTKYKPNNNYCRECGSLIFLAPSW